ncbi:thymidylate synthase [Exiguobacterium sp. HVEsp1]|uniref:thymidylate synthase n=1 Tax=Exiguobacterium sp. HVEsp1 TaxID=1934003 RepID=UPI000990EAC1|nr:thymidylate synthase [Exiguobacterium sp. HVEsp1]
MKTFSSQNFSLMYYEMLEYGYLNENPFTESRVGSVKDLGPVYFEIFGDEFRLPYLNKRAINPFFAMAEFSWVFAGSNELQPLQSFISNYGLYSDDGKTLNGAYGHRLRYKFNIDQIEKAVESLKVNKETRRIVLSMWSVEDLFTDSKDLPCNVSIMLKIRNGKLDITIINRSNDLFMGVPYNIFVFYLLQVKLAKEIGCKVGIQRHFTDSLHIYEKDMIKTKDVLTFNDVKKIKKLSELIPSFNSGIYANENHEIITEQKLDTFIDEDINCFFQSYEVYKATKDANKAIKLLPKNLLGYTAYLWYIDKKSYLASNDFFTRVSNSMGAQL